MDDFLDSFFSSSSSWTDMNAMEKPSWVGSGPIHTSGLLPNSMEVYERDEKNSNRSVNHPSNHIMDTLPTQVTSVLVGGESTYGLNKGLIPGAAPHQQESPDHEIKPFLDRAMNGSSPKLLPISGGLANSPRVLPESGSSGSNDGEPFGLQKFLRDPHSLPSIPQLWSTPSYGALSSLSPVIGQDKIQGFGLQGEHVDNDAKVLGTRYIRDDTVLELDKLRASMSINGQEELQGHNLSSPHITMAKTAGIPSLSQMPQIHEKIPIQHYSSSASFSQLQSAPATATGGCNGTGKPRVRARRGQATDPHSIAERLRREKITERMKNLQELVPNSNKTDKASTLDEIIEYVKFLQLQVKVLSMSRLGAAGAVVPLITDGQAEGSNSLLLAPSTGQGADLSESSENIAFEQEVVKLMESNVTMAMQFLQTKGLCLMPIALATAISGANSSGNESKKPGLTHGIVPHNNSEGMRVNGYNGPSGKQEEVESIPCITREL